MGGWSIQEMGRAEVDGVVVDVRSGNLGRIRSALTMKTVGRG